MAIVIGITANERIDTVTGGNAYCDACLGVVCINLKCATGVDSVVRSAFYATAES